MEGALVYHTWNLEAGATSHGCSAVAIGDNWVLTHATALHPKSRTVLVQILSARVKLRLCFI